jgi:hypothetical protein
VLGDTWMDSEGPGYKPNRRDELISLARYGKITPQEAEAEAAASGFEPFEQQPELPAFDPMLESRWSIVMAVAWIAWRDLRLVRENCTRFRSQSTYWLFREWNEPVNNGTAFARREGWFLETWSEATTVRLHLLEAILKAKDELPPSRRITVPEAEKALWQALSDGHLAAEALNSERQPVDVPQREWSYLKLFEDGKRDVLRYDALDRQASFTNAKLKRDDLLRLWPSIPHDLAAYRDSGLAVEAFMLEPISNPEPAGYVPLCAALHWIMTSGGTRPVLMDDQDAWAASVDKLMPLICGGDFELIGLPRGRSLTERVPGHTLALVKVLSPLHKPNGDILLNAASHVACSSFFDQEHWSRNFNDKLYERYQPAAAWTHLQVRKIDVLSRWPKPEPKVKFEQDCYRWLLQQMQQSPAVKLKSRETLWTEAEQKFRPLAKRQFFRAWDKAIAESGAHPWSKAGRPSKKLGRA